MDLLGFHPIDVLLLVTYLALITYIGKRSVRPDLDAVSLLQHLPDHRHVRIWFEDHAMPVLPDKRLILPQPPAPMPPEAIKITPFRIDQRLTAGKRRRVRVGPAEVPSDGVDADALRYSPESPVNLEWNAGTADSSLPDVYPAVNGIATDGRTSFHQ